MQSGTTTTLSSSTNTTTTTTPYSFEGFLQGWYRRQDELLTEIIALTAETKAGGSTTEVAEGELIARAMGQFEEYYEHKSRAAQLNVFSLFTQAWLSPLECAFFWITGFRPSVLLQLVADSVPDLSPHQTMALHRLKRETRVEEKGVASELATLQENIAIPPLRDVVIRGTRHLDEQHPTATDETMEWLKLALGELVANADSLRVTTAAKVVDILNPAQCLKFLAAAMQLQRGMRRLGMQRDHLAQESKSECNTNF